MSVFFTKVSGKLCCVGIMFFALYANAQIHDFDSLYAANALFRSYVDYSTENYNLYGPEEPLEFSIEGDFKELVREKLKENDYIPVSVYHMLNDTIRITRQIRAKARGNFRRETCKYPPVRLNFKETEFIIPQFQDLGKMKIVVRCQEQERFEQYLMVELLTYKLLNIFTDMSFRTRLIKMNIRDTGGKYKEGQALAFVIETYDELEERLGGTIIDRENIHPALTDFDYSNLIAVFQFMIGNTDWSIPALHNIKVMQFEDKKRPFAIPYDFDYSGLVNAPYAIPSELLPIKDVTARLYRGMCRTPEEFEATFDIFRSKKEEVFKVIDDFEYLNDQSRKWVLKFTNEFYEVIESPKLIKKEIYGYCLK